MIEAVKDLQLASGQESLTLWDWHQLVLILLSVLRMLSDHYCLRQSFWTFLSNRLFLLQISSLLWPTTSWKMEGNFLFYLLILLFFFLVLFSIRKPEAYSKSHFLELVHGGKLLHTAQNSRVQRFIWSHTVNLNPWMTCSDSKTQQCIWKINYVYQKGKFS